MELVLDDLRAGYLDVVATILESGDWVTVRDQVTREVTNVTMVFPHPIHSMLPIGVGRNVNTKLAAVEALSLIAGEARRDLVIKAAPQYNDVLVSDAAGNFEYAAYGPRLEPQVREIAHTLSKDPTSRQAVATIWDARDLTHRGDKPCTLLAQFLVRKDKLELHVTMRSQDVWLGLAYDAFMFTQLQWTLLRTLQYLGLDIGLGQYVLHVGSLHIYERNIPLVHDLRVPSGQLMDRLPQGVMFDVTWEPARAAHQLLSTDDDCPAVLLPERKWLYDKNPWYARQMANVRGDRALSAVWPK